MLYTSDWKPEQAAGNDQQDWEKIQTKIACFLYWGWGSVSCTSTGNTNWFWGLSADGDSERLVMWCPRKLFMTAGEPTGWSIIDPDCVARFDWKQHQWYSWVCFVIIHKLMCEEILPVWLWLTLSNQVFVRWEFVLFEERNTKYLWYFVGSFFWL